MFTTELVYPIRARVLAKYSGQLCQILALLMLIPAVVALVLGAWQFALPAGIVALILGGFGFYFGRLRISTKLQRNEALVIVSTMFLLAALAMTIPMTTIGLAPVDAFFESVSGVTTTGLSVFAPVEQQSLIFHFARAWMQWFGGLGIVIFSLAFIILPGVDARRMSMASGSSPRSDMVSGTKTHAKRVLIVYASLTALGFVALLLSGTSFFNAVIHTLTGVSTGGFSTTNQSIGGLSSAARFVALFLGFFGAISFALYYQSASEKSLKSVIRDPEIKAFIAALVVASAAVVLTLLWNGNLSWLEALSNGSALAISAQTTTGYSTMPVNSLPAASKLVLIVSMFIGANSGSTAGGVKLLRLLLLWKAFQTLIRSKSMPPHAVTEPRLQNRRIAKKDIINAGIILSLFLLVDTVSWFIFLLGGYDPINALFDVVSATGTVGLSTGVTSAQLPAGLKLVLCANMLLGRLEMIALLILFYPNTWFGKRRSSI